MANILIFGDSITWGAWDTKGGWTHRIRTYFEENLHGQVENVVYNIGISGDDSRELLKRIVNEAQLRIDADVKNIILIAIGINDSQFLIEEKKNKISLKDFESNLRELVGLALKMVDEAIAVGLTLVDESKTNPIPWNTNKQYTNSEIKKYNAIIKLVCFDYKIPFIDLISELERENYREMLSDGLHPNNDGHELIANKVKRGIIEILIK